MNRAMALCAIAAVGAVAVVGGCGKDSSGAVGATEPAVGVQVARGQPLEFRVDGMRRVNGAL